MSPELFKLAISRLLFIPYKWAGDDPIDGFDCSGGVQEILAMIGLDPEGDQSAQAIYNYFKTRCTPRSVDLGTLVFYGEAVDKITHVAIAMDAKTVFEFAGGGKSVSNHEMAASQNAYGRLRPLNKRRDLVAVLSPTDLPWAKFGS